VIAASCDSFAVLSRIAAKERIRMHDHTPGVPSRQRALALNDDQLRSVMAAAGELTPEKRGLFLERIAARLKLRGPGFTTDDFDEAVRLAKLGLVHTGPAERAI
jgi:hypothetical protein